MKKKWTNIILPAILMLCGFPAHAAVQIGSNAFPDAAFRTLVQSFDTDHDGVLSNSEIASVTEIDCEKNTSIRDVTGIACFTSLKSLNVWKCPLSKLDVSKNYQLEYLDCCETGISSLDVTSNPDIHQLWCYGNSIAELDLTNNSYLLKAYSNGVYKNDTYISYADEETISYIALDKTVKLKLPSGIKDQPGSSSEDQPGSSSEDQPGSSSEEQPGTTPAGTGHTVAVGETISFDREATIPGDFLEQAFKVDCEDIVSITQARTGNINYADGTTYYFSIWITGVKPGTTSVTVYDNSKTIKIWSTTVTVYGDDVDAEEPAATEPTTDTAEKTDDTVKDAGGTEEQEDSKSETKQDAPKVDTKLTHSGSGLIYTVTKKGKEVSLKAQR